MNFEMQELVGNWFLGGEDRFIGQIVSIDMRGYRAEGWLPKYPVKIKLLSKLVDGSGYWHFSPNIYYLDQLTLITPEVAEIYMQANNLTLPERKTK